MPRILAPGSPQPLPLDRNPTVTIVETSANNVTEGDGTTTEGTATLSAGKVGILRSVSGIIRYTATPSNPGTGVAVGVAVEVSTDEGSSWDRVAGVVLEDSDYAAGDLVPIYLHPDLDLPESARVRIVSLYGGPSGTGAFAFCLFVAVEEVDA